MKRILLLLVFLIASNLCSNAQGYWIPLPVGTGAVTVTGTTWDPTFLGASMSLSPDRLTVNFTGVPGTPRSTRSTAKIATGTKRYFEVTMGAGVFGGGSNTFVGITGAGMTISVTVGFTSDSWSIGETIGTTSIYNNSAQIPGQTGLPTYATGDVICISVDCVANTITFKKGTTGGAPLVAIGVAQAITGGIDYYVGISTSGTATSDATANFSTTTIYPPPAGHTAGIP